VDLINAEIARSGEIKRGVHPLAIVGEDVANGFFVNTNIISDLRKRTADGLTLDKSDESIGRQPFAVLALNRLVECPPAALATVSPTVDPDTNALAMDRRIHDDFSSAAKAYRLMVLTVSA
jgi:hypothetical protein